MNVKIVGNGGGYGYGIMGATHHAIEDIAVLSSFQSMKCFIPFCNEDVETVLEAMMAHHGPSYLRLGYGLKPENISIPEFRSIRQIKSGKQLTIVGLGPVILNAMEALCQESRWQEDADVFVVSEMPLMELTPELKESLSRTCKLLVVEEHVKRGGLGENVAILLLENGIQCTFIHHCAKGYPNGLYGSQGYHQKISELDVQSLSGSIGRLYDA
jgi:transketolase